ncbi:uncharacterized protein HMPREF1541_05275 [Cyphellophora europaea CBS 101466]|uniref:Proline dehydrogenase n=1 Tax=Cyphellophora europaea (strain CBS 101466) TaxID=1220924 RepID=W2RTI5_CYPE1|nr:uncharacterized protein HMPREF1541_05275 [Cyphellophora europaea CBS 101466]ETN39053.1 hypothetical protein HMPREF1541_05275 [Cyphellophora europaea CBS 101466]
MASGIRLNRFGVDTKLTSPTRPRCLPWASTSIGSMYATPGARNKATYASALDVPVKPTETSMSPLARLPTSSVLRSLFLSIFFTSPLLFRPGLAVFKAIATSELALLNPDRNPVLRAVIRPLVYDQFCAGRNVAEIKKTSSAIKQLGFSGVVLCYGKEVQLDANNKPYGYGEGQMLNLEDEVKQWQTGYLNTLKMVGPGDWLGVKLTGAGLNITKALLDGQSAPKEFVEAMEVVCRQAQSQGCRIWIDSEQQVLQKTIDEWTFDLMRRWNKGDKALVFNTVQAYLKCSRDKVEHQLQVAAKEGWRSAIKLVRGAYMSNDKRELIHDTKAETDACYDSIVEDLLHGTGFSAFQSSPELKHDLVLAGHNTKTIRRAASMASDLASRRQLKVVPEFGQLQGMADDIGCELLQLGENASRSAGSGMSFVPRVYKCLTWGSVRECMQYLTRRLVENRGAADRMQEGAVQLRQELWRRLSFRSS